MNNSIRAQIVILSIVATVTASLSPAIADDGGETPHDVLGRLVGTWNVEIVSRPSAQDGEEFRATGAGRTEWFLDEQFVRNAAHDQNVNPADFQGNVFNIWGYDVSRGKYRAWYFDSKGNAGDSDGDYDPETKTLTFATISGEGDRIVTTISFVDENNQNWSTTVKDKDGKLVRSLAMTLQRK